MSAIEAIVVSPTHLELKTPVLARPGQRVFITITSQDAELSARLTELRAAYVAMTEEERQAEVLWAEEGLQSQPPPGVAFPDEGVTPWWE